MTLYTDDLNIRTNRLGQDRNSQNQAAPTGRHHDHIRFRQIQHDLQSNRAVPGNGV
jgi:hypothetical protein